MGQDVRAVYSITTPMFLGDAPGENRNDSSTCADTIRPSSVKGALRFWWRALVWGDIAASHSNESDALKSLHQRESRIFGHAAGSGNEVGQQSRVLMRVPQASLPQPREKIEGLKAGHLYLLGQGLANPKGELKRNYLPDSQSSTFEVYLRMHPSLSEDDRRSVVAAAELFGLLGGLGSRARRGWGSVSLVSINDRPAPATLDAYRQRLEELLPTTAGGDAPLSALGAATRVDISASNASAMHLLEQAGSQMQLYRSFGSGGMVGGEKARQIFRDDHDLVFKFLKDGRLAGLPRRTVFGLPHNYFFSSLKKTVMIGTKGDVPRRASPLMIHIQRIGDRYALVQTVMRSRFLPEGAKVHVNRESHKFRASDARWEVLDEYLAQFPQRQTVRAGA